MDVNVDCNFRAIGLAELVNAKTPREQQSIMITSAACRNDGRWRLIVKEQINGKVDGVDGADAATTDDGGNRLCGWMERRSTKGVDDGQSKNIGACRSTCRSTVHLKVFKRETLCMYRLGRDVIH